MKPLLFVGSTLEDLSAFPAEARRASGYELWQVQNGLMPSDFKVMRAVGAGAFEIRIHRAGEWRIIYVAARREAIYVLHAFAKKSQSTRREDIELAGRRYRQIGE
jgi:phage-related protein